MIPPSYRRATWCATLPQQADGDLAFAFETDGGVVRLRVSEDEAVTFMATLMEAMDFQRRTRAQSEISAGSLNLDGSPQEGQNV